VPYFPQELSTEEEINEYVISMGEEGYLDMFEVVDTFASGGCKSAVPGDARFAASRFPVGSPVTGVDTEWR
ncbi:MAG: hypothetical protein P8127_13985, partial [Acidobacteriota bacterium]